MIELNKIYQGHALDILKTFPDKVIDCIITSPPYWQLRNYQTEHQIWGGDPKCEHRFESSERFIHRGTSQSKFADRVGQITDMKATDSFCSTCAAWKGELGLEPTFKLYIEHLIMIFAECKRVLKDEGSMWVNLGDSYSGSGKGAGGQSQKESWVPDKKPFCENSLKAKSLCNIPSRFAIAMTDELGMIQRNNIIWFKPNCMPSSATDRFTVDFESILFFVKQQKYFFEQQFEKYDKPMDRWGGDKLKPNGESMWDKGTGSTTYRDRDMRPNEQGRNCRAVWQINTSASSEKHYAMYPEKLLVRMIEAGCPKNGIVLDPFAGSGTTGLTAHKLGRNYINIELQPDNVEISERRTSKEKIKIKMF